MRILQRKLFLIVLWGGILIIGAGLRWSALDLRAMHTDEAVHGIKFKALLENNDYEYDPYEYHGPTLNVFTLFPCLITGSREIESVSETHLRIVPAVFGWLLILMPLLFSSVIGHRAAFLSALFITFSPAMVFYSRYYIQEILLVFFVTAALFLFILSLRNRKYYLFLLCGAAWGLASATKETWIIPAGILGIMFVLYYAINIKSLSSIRDLLPGFTLLLLGFAVPFMLFYSEFFTNFSALTKPASALNIYLNRAETGDHQHPWWYYLKLFGFFRNHGPLFTEGFLVLSALGGLIIAYKPGWMNRSLLFFGMQPRAAKYAAGFTLLFALIYMILPYKTPWSFLGVWALLLIWAGLFWKQLFVLHKGKTFKLSAAALLNFGILHLVFQTILLNFKYHSTPENPYVYGHTLPDIQNLCHEIIKSYAATENPHQFWVEVIAPDHDYWPLPWYLRDLPNIGWQGEVDMESPAAPLIVTHLPNPQLSQKLYELPPPGQRFMYIPVFEEDKELRPGASVNVLLRKDYWDSYRSSIHKRGR